MTTASKLLMDLTTAVIPPAAGAGEKNENDVTRRPRRKRGPVLHKVVRRTNHHCWNKFFRFMKGML